MPTPLPDFSDFPTAPELEGSPVAISGCSVSSNLIRITATSHGFSNGDLVYIYGILGTVTANGTWEIEGITANTFDLVNSRWAGHSYTGGTGFAQKINVRFVDQWDGHALREILDCEPITAPTTTETSTTDRMSNRFTQYAMNGKQIFRNSAGTWHVLTEGVNTNYLSTAAENGSNFLKPRGGDFSTIRLTGLATATIVAGGGRSASGVCDADDNIHVIYHSSTGLNYIFHNGSVWSSPLLISNYTTMRNSDIMLDVSGDVVIAYYNATQARYYRVNGAVDELAATAITRSSGSAAAGETALQDVCMCLAPDGKVYMAYRNHFGIYVVVRETNGTWGTPTKVCYEYCWYPSIFIANGEPMVIFQHESKRKIPRDIAGNFINRRGEKCNIGYAVLRDGTWQRGTIVSADEITDNRRGIFENLEAGDQFPRIEQFGVPTVSLDPYGVPTVYWPNLTRRWVFSSRWMGDRWSDPLDIRGPFVDLKRPLMVERQVPTGKTDVGILVWAACDGGTHRAIFDRIHVGSIDPSSENRVLFLDETEIESTSGVTFNLNQFERLKELPAIPLTGSEDTIYPLEIRVSDEVVTIRYNADGPTHYAEAANGVDFVIPGTPTSAPASYTAGSASSSEEICGIWDIEKSDKARLFLNGDYYFLNPDISTPETTEYVRFEYDPDGASGWGSHNYQFGYGNAPTPTSITWGSLVNINILKLMREGNSPQCNDPDDPEWPIRIYSRVYDNQGRVWGMMGCTKESAIDWAGVSHHLDVDAPYVTTPELSEIHSSEEYYSGRGRVYLSSITGIKEDQIYDATVGYANGLYWTTYFAGQPSIPLADMRLAISRDGRNFIKIKNGHKLLGVGNPGTFDSGYIYSPVVCEDTDNGLIHLAYRGTPAVRDGTDAYAHNTTEIGHATMRSWGFTYYTPISTEGTITTIPMTIGANRSLYINATGMTYRGDLYIDLLDEDDEIIEGFEGGCPIETDNRVDNPVSWSGVTELPEDTVKIRFRLLNGVKLYSFRFDTNVAATPTKFRRQPLGRESYAS